MWERKNMERGRLTEDHGRLSQWASNLWLFDHVKRLIYDVPSNAQQKHRKHRTFKHWNNLKDVFRHGAEKQKEEAGGRCSDVTPCHVFGLNRVRNNPSALHKANLVKHTDIWWYMYDHVYRTIYNVQHNIISVWLTVLVKNNGRIGQKSHLVASTERGCSLTRLDWQRNRGSNPLGPFGSFGSFVNRSRCSNVCEKMAKSFGKNGKIVPWFSVSTCNLINLQL